MKRSLHSCLLLLLLQALSACTPAPASQLHSPQNATSKLQFPYTTYDAVEVYVFNRDPALLKSVERHKELNAVEYDMDEIVSSGKLEEWKEATKALRVVGEYSVLDDQHALAASAELITRLSASQTSELVSLFERRSDTLEDDLCIPTYRDAVVFKQEREVVGWIDLCFECSQLKSVPAAEIVLVAEQWDALADFLATLSN